jgi:hypothetical protein
VPVPVPVPVGSGRQVGSDSVQTRLSSGARLRVFYAHQFKPFLDWQSIGYRLKLPRDAFHNIWTRQAAWRGLAHHLA